MSHEPLTINTRVIHELLDQKTWYDGGNQSQLLARAMSHEPLTINTRLINDLFDYVS